MIKEYKILQIPVNKPWTKGKQKYDYLKNYKEETSTGQNKLFSNRDPISQKRKNTLRDYSVKPKFLNTL